MNLDRTHLLFGEWLGRAKRRTDARRQLELAHEMFLGIGSGGFAERSGAEVVATGVRAARLRPLQPACERAV